MKIGKIYKPLADDLKSEEGFLTLSIKKSRSRSIPAMSNYLVESSGKRIRPGAGNPSDKFREQVQSEMYTLPYKWFCFRQ